MAWLSADVQAQLLSGVFWTVVLTALTSVASFAGGIAIGTARLSRHALRRSLATAYIAIHRNIPALVLIIFWAFAIPNLFAAETRAALFFNNDVINYIGQVTGLGVPYYALAALLALTLNTSAYIAELFRAGVGSIATQHLDAARSLGASERTLFTTIILPQGVRAAFPAIATRLIHNMKNTALAALVAVPEFFNEIQGAINSTFRATQLLLLAAVVYLLLSFALTRLLDLANWQLNRRRAFL